MLSNAGSKLKIWAVVVLVLGIISSIIFAAIIFAAGKQYSYRYDSTYIIQGFLVLVLGFFMSWLYALILYAIGDTAEQMENLSNSLFSYSQDNRKQFGELKELMKSTLLAQGAPKTAAAANAKPEAAPVETPKIMVVDRTKQKICCKFCHNVQPSDSSMCWNCGAHFVDAADTSGATQPVFLDKPGAPKPNHRGEHVTVDRIALTIVCPLCGEHQPSNAEECRACGATFSK